MPWLVLGATVLFMGQTPLNAWLHRRPATTAGESDGVAEGLSAAEVGKEIAEHREHASADHAQRDRAIAIFEAVLLSVVALLAAWSGFSAAKWGTESSLSLAKASSTRTKASLAQIQATQIAFP